MAARAPLDVLLTVDTEVWPLAPGWPHTPLTRAQRAEREIDWCLHGGDGREGYGLAWQLGTLADAGLRATYFVDPLFSFALGIDPLAEVVRMVEAAGQELALHVHPEWLTDPRCPPLPRFRGPLMNAYPADEQRAILGAALARLADAGAHPVDAFRAGSWGANRDTLRALSALGLRFDTSLNRCFAVSLPDLDDEARSRLQPFACEGVTEVPVTHFVDRPPAGRRPLHVTAASFDEFRHVLDHAYASGWTTVVVVIHSFEFVRMDALERGGSGRQRLLARRFARMCRYLHDHRDRFVTAHFRDLEPAATRSRAQPAAPRSSLWRTTARHVAQIASRFY